MNPTFGKQDTLATRYYRSVRSNKSSLVASSWHVDDQATPAGGLVIDGQLECTDAHHREQQTVARHARVRADVHVNTVVIYGQLIGDIYSDGLASLARGSTVNGNIYCARLVLRDGARSNGEVEIAKQAALKIAPKLDAVDDSYIEKENKCA
jgi:cytoskeletal protein CcmA (bactofilin family)